MPDRSTVNDDALNKDDTDLQIKDHFSVDNPEFAFICGGLRKIYVNPYDRRARKMLLRKGVRYYSKNQMFLYLCAKFFPIDIFLDIGTNYGECLFSLPLYSKTKARGFEPNLTLHRYLERSCNYNDDLSHVEVQHLAVSDRPGEIVKFFIDTRWSGKSSLNREKGRGIEEVEVHTTTVDLEVDKAGGGETILLKIDVEGFEPSVMKGTKYLYAGDANLIYLMEFDEEFLGKNGTDPEEFLDELKSQYEVLELRGGGLFPIGSFEELKVRFAEKKKIHADIVLLRFCDQSLHRKFHTEIRSVPFKDFRKNLWQMP